MNKHPLASWLYCPRCGASPVEHVHERAIHCPQCDLTYFHNVAAAVAGFVTDASGRILIARRAYEPARGTLDLPGGFAEPGESLESAMRRELMEETGLTALSLRPLFTLPNVYPYSGMEVYTADLIWLVEVSDLSLAQPADDAAELLALPLSEVRSEDFGLLSMRTAVARLIANPELLGRDE